MAVSPPCNVVARQTCETLGAYVVALTYGPASAPHRLAAAVAGSDGVSAVEVLDLPGLRPLRTLSGHTGQVSECSFFNLSSDCLVSCGEDGTCRLWDLRASAAEVQMQTLLSAGGDAITSVSVSPDDAQIACSVAERVAVIDPRSTGEPLWLGDAHSEPVSCVRFRRSRPRELLTGGDDGLVCALDTGTGGARSAARSGGGDEEDDEGLRVVVNVEVAVQKLSFLGEDDGVVAVISTTEALQLWSVHERRPGIRIADYPDLRMDPRLKADESDGYLVDTLFDQRSDIDFLLYILKAWLLVRTRVGCGGRCRRPDGALPLELRRHALLGNLAVIDRDDNRPQRLVRPLGSRPRHRAPRTVRRRWYYTRRRRLLWRAIRHWGRRRPSVLVACRYHRLRRKRPRMPIYWCRQRQRRRPSMPTTRG
eukprot:TRINITY_DN8518_c0_g2_i2.p1 TRINITY_DN8518_c0_g2~~TRINITY_DN8518_c0_g2_i2.p1  ORF type:complete len:435 (-),score=48.09 TRINITY_DN8518_c0_g2_i2:170-1435(-)